MRHTSIFFFFILVSFLSTSCEKKLSPGARLALTSSTDADFGSVYLSQSAEKTLTFKNEGDLEALKLDGSLSVPFSFKGSRYPGTGGTCGESLAAGESCTVVVVFRPRAAGESSQTLTLFYTNKSSDAGTITLRGTGVASRATLSISDGETYDFGTISTISTATKTFTVSNLSTRGLKSATGISASGLGAQFTFYGGTYPGTGGTCSTTLNSNESCTLVLQFTPGAVGTFSKTLTLSYDDGVETSSTSRGMTGTAVVIIATLEISDGATYDFGTKVIGSTTDKTLTVTNSTTGGSVNASAITATALSSPFSFKGGSFPGTGGNCTATLSPGSSCNVVIRFAPVIAGVQSGVVELSYNNSLTTELTTRPITGTGVTPASLSISIGTSHDFGLVVSGNTSAQTFTVTNSGQSQATGLSVSDAIAAPFTHTGGTFPGGGTCGATLNANSSCTFSVTYAPVTDCNPSDTLGFSYSDGVNSQTFGLALSGTMLGNGCLDPTFNTTGKVVTIMGTGPDNLHGVYPVADDKILAVGSIVNTAGNVSFTGMARYNSDGSADTSFGTAGKAISTHFNLFYSYASEMQTDGKLLVCGAQSFQAFGIARYLANGSLDTSFHTDGMSANVFDIEDICYKTLVQPNGKIVGVGSGLSSDTWETNFVIVRLEASGNLDTSFATRGHLTLTMPSSGGYSIALAAALQTEGEIVFSGLATDHPIAIARVTSGGRLDTTFLTSGVGSISYSSGVSIIRSILPSPANTLVLGGSLDYGGLQERFVVLRTLSSGKLDTSFETDGFTTTSVGTGVSAILATLFETDGTLVTVGDAGNNFGVVRYGTSGTVTSRVTADFGTGVEGARAVALQTNGKIVVGGVTTGSNLEFAIARFVP